MNSKHFWYAFPKNKQSDGRCVSLAPWKIVWNLVGWSNCINFELRFSSTLADVAFLRRKTLSTHAHTQSSQEGSNMPIYHIIGMKKWILKQIHTYIYIYAYDICLYYITYITIFKHIYIYYIYTRFQHVLIVLILPISSGGVGRSTRLIKVSLCFFSSLGCGFRWVWVKDLFFFWGGNLWDRLIFVKRNLRKMSRKSTLAAIHAWRIGPHGGRIRG